MFPRLTTPRLSTSDAFPFSLVNPCRRAGRRMLLQQAGLHLFLRQQLHWNGLGMPDIPAVLTNRAVRRELAGTRRVENAHARPALPVAVGLIDERLALRVRLVVREHEIRVLEREVVDERQ